MTLDLLHCQQRGAHRAGFVAGTSQLEPALARFGECLSARRCRNFVQPCLAQFRDAPSQDHQGRIQQIQCVGYAYPKCDGGLVDCPIQQWMPPLDLLREGYSRFELILDGGA
jgi:hypothetical protein